MNESPATEVDRAALEAVRKLGMRPVEVSLPDWPYGSLNTILFAEGAAAFEELTLSGGLDQLKAQVPDAWPNTFRQSRFLSAVDYVQADRLRRKVAIEMMRVFDSVDVLLVPSLRDEILTITNFTGHPALVLRAGFVEVTQARSDWAPDPKNPMPTFATPRRVPHGVCLIGRMFDEGTIGDRRHRARAGLRSRRGTAARILMGERGRASDASARPGRSRQTNLVVGDVAPPLVGVGHGESRARTQVGAVDRLGPRRNAPPGFEVAGGNRHRDRSTPRRSRASMATSIVVPLASPSSTRITRRPETSGTGTPPRIEATRRATLRDAASIPARRSSAPMSRSAASLSST